MKRIALALTLALALAGCGGESGPRTSVISGTVLYLDGSGSLFPVRNGVVKTRFGSVRTSSSGAFRLERQGDEDVEVTAEAEQDGIDYRGRTTVFNFEDTETPSVNILVGRVSELGVVRGFVQDSEGRPLEGASVFANLGVGSSVRVFTDRNGRFEMRDLIAGYAYTLSAGGIGYGSSQREVTLAPGEELESNFVVDQAGLPDLQPPQDLSVVTWVSPTDAVRRPDGRDPFEAVKRLIDKDRERDRAGKTRQTASRAVAGSLIEADLEWTPQQFRDLYGYGVYKSNSATGALAGIDLFPDPLGAYYVDLDLSTFRTYSYALTTISALYPDFRERTESELSERVVADTLGPLRLGVPLQDPLTFRWQQGSGAETYVVFLFEEFPGVGIESVWNNFDAGATGTSAPYDGPPLQPGRTYYYLIVGLANQNASRTISQVGSFRLSG